MITHPSQTRLLAEIGRQEIDRDAPGVSAMATALGLDKGNVSRTLKRMEADGWITRDPLALTPAGRATLAGAAPVLIPHDRIDPGDNPRHMYLREGSEELAALRDLAESLATQGQQQAILVRPVANGCYEIVAGERRWRAMALLITEDRWPADHPVAAALRPLGDEDAMIAALAENMARRDMNPMDEAEGLFSVYGPRVAAAAEGEKRKTQADTVAVLASATGQSVRHIQARIRLARDLTESVRTMVRRGELSVTFANELVSWPPVEQAQAAGRIAARAEGWRTVEEIRAQRKGGAETPEPAPGTATAGGGGGDTATPGEALPPDAIRAGRALHPGVPAMATEIPASEPNEHGVYEPTVIYEIIRHKSPWVQAHIRMAKCRDALYRFSIDYTDSKGGGSGPISARGEGFVTASQIHYAALNALAQEARKTLQRDAIDRSALLAMAAIRRFAAAWQIDINGTADVDGTDFNADPAVNPEPAPGTATDKDTARVVGPGAGDGTDCADKRPEQTSHSGDAWPRDEDGKALTDRALLHALAHAIAGGAMRITIEADPLARPVAAELMARLTEVAADYGAVEARTGGNRAIISGVRA